MPDNHDGTAYFAQYDGVIQGTVSYPEGVYTNAAGTRLNYAVGDDITFDGSKTELYKDSGAYGMFPLRLSLGNTWFIGVNGYTPSGPGETWAVLSNFTVRTTMSADRLSVDAAGFFHYPKGVFTVFGNTTSAAANEGVATLKPGAGFKANAFSLEGKTFALNALVLDDATLETGALTVGRSGTTSVRTSLLVTNGASVAVSGAVNLSGVEGGAIQTVFDHAALTAASLNSTGTGAQTNELTFADSTVDVAGTFAYDSAMARRMLKLDRSFLSLGGTWTLAGETEIRDSAVEYDGNWWLNGNGRLTVVGSTLTNLTAVAGGPSTYFGGTSAATTATVYIADSDIYHKRQIYSNFANVMITNSTVKQDLGNDTSQFCVRYGADVKVWDSTVSVGDVTVGNDSVAGHVPRLTLIGSRVTGAFGNSHIGKNYDGLVTLSNATWTTASLYLGGDKVTSAATTATATGYIRLTGQSVYTPGTNLRLGSATGGGGEVVVADESVFNVPGANFSLGWYGHGSVLVRDNARLVSSGGIKLATEASADTVESLLHQTGGTITAKGVVTVAEAAGRSARVRLDGGVLTATKVVGGAGTAAFEANGGTIAPTAATTELLSGFVTAALGEKGLTVDSAYDVTISQGFTDQAGAEEKGELVLKGAGTKTLAMTANAPSVVVAAGGDVAFAAGTAYPKMLAVTNGARVVLSGAVTFENLAVGSDASVGVLVIDSTTRLTVTGDLDIRNLQVVLTGDFSTPASYDLISCPNGVSAASVDRWTQALATAGLADGTACEFERVDGEGSAVSLRMNVVEGDTITIQVDAGEETRTTNVLYNASQKLKTIVADGASLTLEGKLGYGELEKTGAGTLYLTGLDNVFYLGLSLVEGVLVVSNAFPLGNDNIQNIAGPTLRGGQLDVRGDESVAFGAAQALTIDGTEANALTEVRASTDVTMPMPAVVQGAFRKRGPGRLVFEASENGQICNYSQSGNGENPNEAMTGYTGFTVQEGEMVFRGTRPGVTNTITCNVTVGVPGEKDVPGKVQPGLVVDNVDLSIGGNTLRFGAYITNFTHRSDGGLLGEANTFVTDPYLIVTNGAVLRADVVMSFDGCWFRTLAGQFHSLIDGATVLASSKFGMCNRSGDPNLLPMENLKRISAEHVVWNGGALCTPETLCEGSFSAVFDHAYLGGPNRAAHQATFINYNTQTQTSNWELVSSEFCVHQIDRSPSKYQCTMFQRFTFEDTLWSCGDADLRVGSTNVNVNLFVRGRGLKFAPYAGRTYRVIRKIRGDGGIVMDGPGLLKFERSQYLNQEQKDTMEAEYVPSTVAYTGTTEVNGGTIDFGGFALTNMTFAGTGGVISNATLVSATTSNTNLTYGAGIAFVGRTRVDFSGLDVAIGDMLTVGRYDGTAPDVSAWRVENFKTRGLTVTFAAADGEIVATVRTTGLQIIIR